MRRWGACRLPDDRTRGGPESACVAVVGDHSTSGSQSTRDAIGPGWCPGRRRSCWLGQRRSAGCLRSVMSASDNAEMPANGDSAALVYHRGARDLVLQDKVPSAFCIASRCRTSHERLGCVDDVRGDLSALLRPDAGAGGAASAHLWVRARFITGRTCGPAGRWPISRRLKP